MKSILLKNKYIKKINSNLKLKKFYSNSLELNGKSESVLFWSTGGMIIQTNLEGVIASSLKLRGHRVRVVLCDGVYKACAKRVDFPEVEIKDWGSYCKSCIRQNAKVLERLGLDVTLISELVPEDKIGLLRAEAEKVNLENYKKLSYDGIHLGPHLESSMMRHTKGGPYDDYIEVLKEYAFAILINTEASRNAVKKYNPSKVYMSHGIYADWGPALSVFLNGNIPITSYICCYLTAHFFFGTVKNTSDTFLTIGEDSWEEYFSKGMTEVHKKRLVEFLNRRYHEHVSQDMKGLMKQYKGNDDLIYEKYELDKDKPVWGIMTHINWDAASDYFDMIHENFDEWLYETIKEIYNVTDVQWLIKIHPSELNDNPETGCQKFIENNFPDLPPHIKVIKMDDDISSLDFYNILDGAVTVMGTGGLELSIKGKPVILAGDAHYSKKGFTFDAKDREDYGKLLRNAGKLQKLDKDKLEHAWKYAYIYFIQKQIPLLPTIGEDLYIDFAKLDYLIPGKNKFMDFICEKIIDGKDFILPEELVQLTHVEDKDQIRTYA